MEALKIKLPAYAGSFYPQGPKEIKALIKVFLAGAKPGKTECLGCVLPHAGYIYSGKTASLTAAQINIPDTVVLLGPNHTGLGQEFSLFSSSPWQTPLGKLEINQLLAKQIFKSCPWIKEDSLAHINEHSLEVELPILQYFRQDFKIVPIAIASDNLSRLKETGIGIAAAIQETKQAGNVLIAASSDMTHYEPLAQAREKDNLAIEAILRLDEDGLMESLKKFKITMCGYAPVIIMLSCVKKLGAKSAQLVNYSTSAERTNDPSSVVGYAGIKVY